VQLDGAEELPGSYFFSSPVDAHAHPAAAPGPVGPVSHNLSQTSATLVAWAEAGVTLVRNVGRPQECARPVQ
jgi:hypothetical protein